MSELDEKRRVNFIDTINDNQVFITCTDKICLNSDNNKIYKINQGKKYND